MDMMVLHGQAVRRGVTNALVIVDLPFGSYEASPDLAMRNAARLLAETGCNAVKLEGGQSMAKTIEFLTARGVPVVGHVGLTPQHVNALGGFKLQGRGIDAKRVLDDAKAVAQSGAFSVVVEKVPDALAEKITGAVTIPTIGIGASAKCDGQILVMDDVLGVFTAFKPRFAKRYAELGDLADKAIGAYAADVRARTFPGPDNVYQDNLKK
jgi:3-methyl-2-oxobutanoate hydroxymethyltransferase